MPSYRLSTFVSLLNFALLACASVVAPFLVPPLCLLILKFLSFGILCPSLQSVVLFEKPYF